MSAADLMRYRDSKCEFGAAAGSRLLVAKADGTRAAEMGFEAPTDAGSAPILDSRFGGNDGKNDCGNAVGGVYGHTGRDTDGNDSCSGWAALGSRIIDTASIRVATHDDKCAHNEAACI